MRNSHATTTLIASVGVPTARLALGSVDSVRGFYGAVSLRVFLMSAAYQYELNEIYTRSEILQIKSSVIAARFVPL